MSRMSYRKGDCPLGGWNESEKTVLLGLWKGLQKTVFQLGRYITVEECPFSLISFQCKKDY